MMKPWRARTPKSIIVYPKLFVPEAFKVGDPKKYSATFLFEKDADLTEIRKAMNVAAHKFFPNQPKEFYQKLRSPIRDGNKKAVDGSGNPDPMNFYYNRLFINARGNSEYKEMPIKPPKIVDRRDKPITDPGVLYGGCVVYAILDFYGYDYMGNCGVSCSVSAVMKREDGDPIGGSEVDTGAAFKDLIEKEPPEPDGFDPGEFEPGDFGDDIPY